MVTNATLCFRCMREGRLDDLGQRTKFTLACAWHVHFHRLEHVHSNTFIHSRPTWTRPNLSSTPLRSDAACSRLGSRRHSRRVLAMDRGVISGKIQPFLPCSTTSPQNRVVIIGSFQACASSCVRPNP